MKYLIPVILFNLIPVCAWSQAPMPMPAGRTQKVLTLQNEKTGHVDTIKMGDFIKLWFWSDKRIKMEQPLTRTDFNKNTYYIESNLLGVTDTTLIFLKRSPFLPIPAIPLPIPLPVPIPNKIPMHEFDTIRLRDIRGIRLVHRALEGAAIGVTMVPATFVVPEYFTTWPGMMFMQPSMQVVSTYIGDVIFPLHKVNREHKQRFSLGTGEIPVDTMYYIQQRKMNGEHDYEWEVERLERYDKMYKHIKKEMNDKLLDTYQGNTIFNITLGVTMIPEIFKSGEDLKSHISITERKFYFGIASENWISERHRIGTELTLNRTEKFTSLTGTSTSMGINASLGMILSNFTYLKWGLKGWYSEAYKQRQWAAIHRLDEDIARAEALDDIDAGLLTAKRNYFRKMLAAEPKPYLLFGIGAINTTLVRIKGSNASGIGATDYSQKKFAIEGGFGMFTRMGKRLTYDFSAKYIWSPMYSPAIGGLERYSGFRLQLNIGYMSGMSFMRTRKMLKQVNTNREPKEKKP